MKYKMYLKVISVILILTLILQSIPIDISAQTVSETEVAVEQEISYAISEDIALREESVKHFRMSDGSFTAISYASPVHYLDGNGEYKDIDNTIVSSQAGYQNTDNPFSVTLPEESDGEVSVESEGKKITFKLLDSKKVKTKIKENKHKTEKEIQKEAEKAKTKKEKAKIINDDKYTLKKYSSGVTYEGIANDVDISYDIYGSSLKESIVLNKKNAKSSYTYAFTYTGLTAILNEDNSVSFMDGEKEYFKLAAPYMFDSDNAYSSNIEVMLTPNETGCTYELIPDKEWLKDKERVYPVTIDPTVTPKLNAREIKDATAIFTNYNSSMKDWAVNYPTGVDYDHLVAGKYPYSSVEVGYCIYAAIPDGIPDTARIVKASLVVASSYAESNVYVKDVRFNAFKITSDWNTGNINEESILFTTPNTNGYSIPTTDTEAIDYRYLSEGVKNYHDFDITKAAQEWYNGDNNYGIMLRMDEYSLEMDNLMAFYSSDYNVGGITNRPLFVYNYRDTSGLEDYWSYHSAASGNAGTGYVNDFGGNLTFIHNDTSYVNERYNISLSHVYNSNNSSASSPYGNGWKLNIGEFGSETIENKNYYYYIDGDGTKHYFYDDDGTYKDEDGLRLVYSTVSGTYPKKITTKNHETMLFDSNGKLHSITDSNSNCVEFTYGDYGLTAVKIGNQNVITLAYTGGKLSSVTNNKTSRTTSYAYDTSGNLVSITQNWDSNTADTYTYTYSGNLLTSATDSTGYRISYGYSTTGTVSRIQSVTESALDSNNQRVNGQVMTFSYQNGSKTVVTDCGLDGNIATTADNNQMTYLFDVFGQPVSVYDEDGKGANYKYSDIENQQHNLTLSSATYGYLSSENYIKDADFINGELFWDYSRYVDLAFPYATISNTYISQTLILDKGKYTVSADFLLMTDDALGRIRILLPDDEVIISAYTGSSQSYNSSAKIEIENDGTQITAIFEEIGGGTIQVYKPNIYKLPHSSKNNYIIDGRFNYASAEYESASEWQMDLAIFGAGVENIQGYNGIANKVMSILPSCAPTLEVYNKVYCNPFVTGKAGDVLLLSGWAKATAINDDSCAFALELKINHNDGTTTIKQLDFNNNVTDWQFGCLPVPIEKDYSSATVTIDYSNQINVGYFDDIQLIKDDATSYVYDDDGNIVSAKTAATNSQYKYDGDSRLTSAIDTTGRNFKYNYDDNHNLTSAVSDAATVVRYEYNSFGQATSSETYANVQHSEPEDGGTYYMFLRSTGWYMDKYTIDSEPTVIHDRYGGAPNSTTQEFVLTKQSDGYYTISNNGSYITAQGTTEESVLKYGNDATVDEAHFKFERGNDGGYRIVSKVNEELCISNVEGSKSSNSALILSSINQDSDEQVWYLEACAVKDQKPVIKDKAIYAIRAFDDGRYFAPDALTAGSKLAVVTGENNCGKFFIERYGNTDYYHIKVVDTNLALCYNDDAENSSDTITLEERVDGSDSQLFSINVHEEDVAGRSNHYSISINPKLDASMYVYAWILDNVSARTYHGYFGCYLFFEELLYSSSTAEYNADGTELVSTTDNASGLKTQYEYDDIGRVTKTSIGQRVTENEYDNRDRVTGVSSGRADVWYTYNDKDQLSNIMIDAGYGTQNYAFTYDTFGNNTKISVGDYTLAQYSYIGNTGLMSAMTYGNNDTIGYTYDKDYRVTKTVYTDKDSSGTVLGSKTVGYEYDMFGNVYSLTDGFSGNTTTYSYDLLGRITKTSKSGGLSRSITYDTFDRINGFTLSVLGKNIHSAVNYGDFGQVNSFTNKIGDRVDTISYTYDDFLRRTERKLETIDKTSTYTYLKGNDGQDTVLVETLNNGKDTYKYTYDIYGNITSVAKNGTVVENYQYDKLNQLTYAKIGEDVYRYTYTLNRSSNLEFVYKNGQIIKTYGYMSVGDRTWVDKLSSFTGTGIDYDEIGNPLNWRDGMTFSWEYGRRLKGVTKGTYNISYTYDADALRTSKTVNGTTTDYYWLDGVLQGQKTGNEHIIFLYDENGAAYGMLVNDNGTETYYYYLFNLQGDIVGIMDSTGATVVEYTYDAWGSLLSVTGDTALGNKNPLRYRGYYYDTETGLYYVSSRYYDPEIGRWINADGYVSTGQDLTGYNMFAYCGNNPVNRKDPTGQFWITALIVTAVAVVCTVALSGCSAQPTSDVGAAKPYVDMPGSDDPTSPNCYAYAIGSPVNEQPGGTSGRIPTKWNDVNDVGKSVEADLKAKGHTVREISGPDAKVYDNEFKIALRVGTQPYAYNQYTGQLYYDYHFMRQTNTGQWAEKHGYGGASILWDAGMTPDTIPWTLGGVPYYDSAIIYYAVGN